MQSPLTEVTEVLAGQSLRVLVWDRDLVDMWCLDAAGRRVPYQGKGSHWHIHAELELTVITGGDGMLYVGDHIGRFRAPDCILVGSRVPHVWVSQGAIAGVSVQFSLELGSGLAGLPEFDPLAGLWSRSAFGVRWSGACAQRLCAGLTALDGTPALARLTRFLELVGIMHAAPASEGQSLSGTALARERRIRAPDAMRRVLDHLIDHFREDLRLADLVRMSGRSQATFCRHFAAMTGRTFNAYLNAIRIQDVRRALAGTSTSVTDIAFDAGFSNLSHFHAVFRRASGCTPLAFRRQHAVPNAAPLP